MKKLNLIVTGVGGQGTISASRILAKAAARENLKVRAGETYGAAMRGGPVASHVRIGEGVYSPLNRKREVDVVLALEPLEGLRIVSEYLSKQGFFITNTEPWYPYEVNVGRLDYPSMEKIEGVAKKIAKKVESFDANSLAKKSGDVKVMNMVMLGTLSNIEEFPISSETFKEVIQERVPKGIEETNLEAFENGFKAI